ncbi:MAG: hypothetical protein WCB18_08385 [Thermoplasmata archaeon]
MTETTPSAPSAPKYKYGTLWAVLLLFMAAGTVAATYVVWGLSDLVLTGHYLVDVPVAIGAAVVTVLCVLFIAGILYRVDRLRGVPHREVALFE